MSGFHSPDRTQTPSVDTACLAASISKTLHLHQADAPVGSTIDVMNFQFPPWIDCGYACVGQLREFLTCMLCNLGDQIRKSCTLRATKADVLIQYCTELEMVWVGL